MYPDSAGTIDAFNNLPRMLLSFSGTALTGLLLDILLRPADGKGTTDNQHLVEFDRAKFAQLVLSAVPPVPTVVYEVVYYVQATGANRRLCPDPGAYGIESASFELGTPLTNVRECVDFAKPSNVPTRTPKPRTPFPSPTVARVYLPGSAVLDQETLQIHLRLPGGPHPLKRQSQMRKPGVSFFFSLTVQLSLSHGIEE
jgi:hypothetical protein